MDTELRTVLGGTLLCLVTAVSLSGVTAQPPEVDFKDDPLPKHYEPLGVKEQRELAAARDKARYERRDPELRQKRPPIDWIRVAYHGRVYDDNLEPIEFNAEVLAAMQESLFEALTKLVAPEYWAKADGVSAETLDRYVNSGYDGYDQLAFRQEILNRLVDAAPNAITAEYSWRLNLLDDYFWREISLMKWAIHPDVLEQMSRIWFYLSPGNQYVKDCRDQGVPIPPDFPDASRWKYQGELGYTFISQQDSNGNPLTAEVYAYQDTSTSTPGTCIALPRARTSSKYSAGGDADLIGIICQSSKKVGKSQHACFWDNLELKPNGTTGNRLNGQSNPMTIGYVADGYSLSENCTECHRGNNVFNIHPGTALDLSQAPASKGGPYPVSAGWYQPIGRSNFTNPPAFQLGPPGLSQRSCETCHSIGSLAGVNIKTPARGYCNIIADAAHRTMPPLYYRDPAIGEGAAGWPSAVGPKKYQTHINVLRAVCNSAVADVLREK